MNSNINILCLDGADADLQAVLSLVGLGRYAWEPNTNGFDSDDRLKALWGRVPGARLTYASFAGAIHPEDRHDAIAAMASSIAAHSALVCDLEYRVRGDDGIERWIVTRGQGWFERKQPPRFIGVAREVSERRRTQQTKDLLIAELQHRVRNLITVVRSIAREISRSSTTLSDFTARLNDRLGALARVQGLLYGTTANREVSARELITMELAALGADANSTRISGPHVAVPAAVVQTLALALHELATNALKYGALTAPNGILDIEWEVRCGGDQPRLILHWRERGLVRSGEAHRAGRGFGRELIERALPFQLNARTQYRLAGAELDCTIDVPLTKPGENEGEFAAS